MNKKNNNKHGLSLESIKSFLFFLLILFFVFSINLKTTQAVTVGPVKLEYDIDPGTTVGGEMYIKNEEAIEKTFYPYVEMFTEQDGQKVFPKDISLISEWFSTTESITLKPGEGLKVPFTLTVPNDAPPGGQFAVIWWGNVPPKAVLNQQEVSIQTRAGILVYINISGNTIEKASIDFRTIDDRSIFGNTTVPFNLKVKNEGNVYIKPTGSLKITSIFGTKIGEIIINPKQLQILPQSSRSFDNMVWYGSRFSFGPYKTEATVFYGKNGASTTLTKWIWIIPIKLISIVVVTIVILFIGITSFFKMYNRRLIKKFKESNFEKNDEYKN